MITLRPLLLILLFIPSALFCSVKSKILDNGLRIINIDVDNKYPGVVMNVFVRGGASLSFDKKSSFAGVARDYMDARIKRLSRSYGFRYSSKISMDYTSYVFHLSKSSFEYAVPRILRIFFDPEPITEQELDYLRNGASQRALWNINRRQIQYPLISFLSSRQSIYNAGLDGFIEDISSIHVSEFNRFARCYFSTNNVVISFAGIKDKDIPVAEARIYRPCFKDENFEIRSFEPGPLPMVDFSYYQAAGSGFIARMGFLSSSCNEQSVLYDLVTEVLSMDDRLSSLTSTFYPSNNCYLNTGTLDLVFSGPGIELSPGTILKELSSYSERITEQDIELAKQGLMDDYYKKLSDKADLSYLLGKTELLCKGHERLLGYVEAVKKVDLNDVKKAINDLSKSKYVYIMMKMGK